MTMKRATARQLDAPTGIASATALPDRLWTQPEAAAYLGVSARYLRESGCPKVLLPGNGPKGQPIVRYRPADVDAWVQAWHTGRPSIRRA